MNKITIKRIFSYIKNYKAHSVFAFMFAALNVIFTLLIPVVIGDAVDVMISTNNVDFDLILTSIIKIAVFAVIAAISQWFLFTLTRTLATNISKDITKNTFDTVNKMPLKQLDLRASGDIMSRLVNDSNLVSEGVFQGLTQLLPGVCTIVGTLTVMIILNPVMALIVVLITPVSIFFASFMAKKTSKYFKRQSKAQGELSAYINEMIGAQSLIHDFGAQEECFDKLDMLAEEARESGVKSTFYSSVTNPGTRFVNAVVYAIVGVVGAIATVQGALSVGQLSIFLTYANQYTKPFNEVSGVLTQMQSAIAGAKRMFDIIDTTIDETKYLNKNYPENINGDIKFENVDFSYTDKPFIKNMNINVKRGEHVAIVGPTGCGKTTLINLLMRFYDINSGEIALNNIAIDDIDLNAYRNYYGMVLQDTWLKNASVRDNISYGKPNANIDEIISAAKCAYAHSFIKRLPQGYDTIITSGGQNLSAGQRQLLCIARIMLCEPEILLLDEATSSIDTRTEMLIQKGFDKLMHNRTSFIVAHRLSTIQNADCILYMKDGNIIESGTHDELLEKNGFYKDLYKSQFAVI